MRVPFAVRSVSSLFQLSGVAISWLCIVGCGASAKVDPQGQPATKNPSAISPELIQKVNDLIRWNKEYITLAETVKTFDDYKKNADALSSIEQQSSSLVEDVMIAEAKLSAAQKAEFNSKYYESLAKPTIEEKRRQSTRIKSLIR